MDSSATRTLKLGVFGSPGSFSEEAGLKFAEREGLSVRISHLRGSDSVMRALDEGRVGIAVLPVFNTAGGLVRATFEALGAHSFEPVGQVTLHVRHCLLVHSSSIRRTDVLEVASHPQALVQCARFLSRELTGRRLLESSDTATAAKELAAGALPPSTAVIASRRAAAEFGLEILAEDVQDDADNRTTFLVLTRRAP